MVKFGQVCTDKEGQLSWAESHVIVGLNLWRRGCGGSHQRNQGPAPNVSKRTKMTYKPIELRPLGGKAERYEENMGEWKSFRVVFFFMQSTLQVLMQLEIGGTEDEFLSQFGLLLLFSLWFFLAVLQPLCMSTFVETLRGKKKKVKRMGKPWMGLGRLF